MKAWLVLALAMAGCGPTPAATGGVDDASVDSAAPDATLPDGWECDPANFDSSDDNCQCCGTYLNHVCIDGKLVCQCACEDVQDGGAEIPDTAGTDAIADASPDVNDSSGTDATSDATAAPYSAVQAIFDARCTNCHSATALGLPGYAALPLTSDSSYKNLVNQPAHETCGGTLVTPGSTDKSYLWHKLNDATPCYGSHMPAQFEILPAPPLTAAQLAAIEAWITAGAQP